MKKMLVTGGSHAEVPMIEAAKDMGWYVITTGNNADGQGHQVADRYVEGDFSDKQFVLNLAKEEKVEAILSGCNDFAYISTAYACEQLGLPGSDTYETARRIHIKSNFREVLQSLDIKCPKAIVCRDRKDCQNAIEEIGLPLFVKPVDLTGGKGIKKCTNDAEIFEAFDGAISQTREDYVILEQFIEGSSHGMTSLIKNGRVVFHILDNEQYGLNKYLVLGASSPSDIPQHAEFTLIRDVEKLAHHCNLVDGLFHVQFILDDTGYPVMIDPCRRAPGDLYVLLAKHVTGVDYPREIVRTASGEELSDFYIRAHNFVARECIMTSKVGRIKDVYIDESIKKSIVHQYLQFTKGFMIEEPLKYKAGILIMKFESNEKMVSVLENFQELVRIELEENA